MSGTASGSERTGRDDRAHLADRAGAHRDGAAAHTDDTAARLRVDPGAVTEVRTERPTLALTFDDGPDPAYTPTVLRALRAAGVTATFFLIGRNAVRYPDLVLQMVEEGHEVANHTFDHLWLDSCDLDSVRHQIVAGEAAVAAHASGRWFRPPRGWTSPVVAQVCREQRLDSVFWSLSFERHQAKGVAEASSIVVDQARAGSVILCHDGGHLGGPNPQAIDRSRTVQAVPRIVDGVLDKGLVPVRLSDLVAMAGA